MKPNAFESETFGKIGRFGLRLQKTRSVSPDSIKTVSSSTTSRLLASAMSRSGLSQTSHKGKLSPKAFRLPGDEALINRLGFSNDGAAVIAGRLGVFERGCVVAA